jgi:hypothetical protein
MAAARTPGRLSPLEVENVREFWSNAIKGKPAPEVNAVFRRMFKDMRHSKLKKVIFASASQVAGLTFAFLAELVLNVTKETQDE